MAFTLPPIKALIQLVVHLTIWAVFILAIATANLSYGLFAADDDTWTIPSIYGNVFNAFIFYGNAYWLIPKFWYKRRLYTRKMVIYVLVLTALESLIDLLVARYYYPSIYDALRLDPLQMPLHMAWFGAGLEALLFANLPIHIIFIIFSIAYRLTKDWVKSEREKQELQNQKLMAELKYLKAQINPHFLFNGINNLYHLIDEDVEESKAFLIRFAHLLRYQLYECEVDFISLDKELQYLGNYIFLQKIRKGQDAVISFHVEAFRQDYKIAPLIFTPFVENAFKYLSSHSDPAHNKLAISLVVDESVLVFQVKNSFDVQQRLGANGANGLGLKNAKSRLNLIYPERHSLRIGEEEGTFQVWLKILL